MFENEKDFALEVKWPGNESSLEYYDGAYYHPDDA